MPLHGEETEMNGEPYQPDDLCLDITIAPAGAASHHDQAAIDQVLRLTADYHAELGAELGRSSVAPSIAALRPSPLGRK
jgi:hypothetical protein